MKRTLIASSLGLLIALTGLGSAHAGPGHDHGDAPAAPSASVAIRRPAAPPSPVLRFAIVGSPVSSVLRCRASLTNGLHD